MMYTLPSSTYGRSVHLLANKISANIQEVQKVRID